MGTLTNSVECHSVQVTTSFWTGRKQGAINCGSCRLSFEAKIPDVSNPAVLCPHCRMVNVLSIKSQADIEANEQLAEEIKEKARQANQAAWKTALENNMVIIVATIVTALILCSILWSHV